MYSPSYLPKSPAQLLVRNKLNKTSYAPRQGVHHNLEWFHWMKTQLLESGHYESRLGRCAATPT